MPHWNLGPAWRLSLNIANKFLIPINTNDLLLAIAKDAGDYIISSN